MQLDFQKGNGLVPVVIQNATTLQVLMLGYMNPEAFDQTNATGKVTFYSRSKQRLWVKGESSGNFLTVASMSEDCDSDALLIKAFPAGPTCHKGTNSCFGKNNAEGFLYQLEQTVEQRIQTADDSSYTYRLTQKGINKVAQKVGEEAVEVVIESKDNNLDLFENECADLLYHLLILLQVKGTSLKGIEKVLLERTKA